VVVVGAKYDCGVPAGDCLAHYCLLSAVAAWRLAASVCRSTSMPILRGRGFNAVTRR
jgi:hypothetical protein